ncbi:uncharacterized protein HMPREF1541_03157 [Cyphellophora europaea CBS 101466]|uniref:Uncharacterized protein n=1 Tax=Cyphellophora europaea (strain CBS 101466) TaxID=1220924 RepID=W2RXP7_CYPE1|nr:uncharacterized protein HMPREF1541_03157 [Cyphellophora europaea CBS 101466]ETN41222.1 hypothetical protein HMPREF1541_03157 [Cyphellophora europaea CBS 101466]
MAAITQPLCHVLTPVGCLGFGIDEDICDQELARLSQTNIPTAIILDSGSTDSGPQKLAHGTTSAPRSAYVRDLGKLLRLVHKYRVPLLFSSAGGDGSGKHVDDMLEVINEVQEVSDQNYKTKCLAVYADVSKARVKENLANGKIRGCGSAVPLLTDADIEGAPTIVGQMGAEPFLDAMYAEPNYNVIVGGRSYDPAPFVAFMAYTAMGKSRVPLSKLPGSQLGGFFHIGKILECGAQCATPKSRAARATIYRDGSFDVIPLDQGARCTAVSVAAHTLYEKSRPDLLLGPGGCLDLTAASYEELEDGKSVRSMGAKFQHSRAIGEPYTIKLEGARSQGYRSMFVGAFRDSALTEQIDFLFQKVREYVKLQHRHYADEDWDLVLHKFGVGEVCVVGETRGVTQDLANSVANAARVACIHGPYPGQKATSGNMAFGIAGKTEIEAGPSAEFCIYHLMELSAGEEGATEIDSSPITRSGFVAPRDRGVLFSWRQVEVGKQAWPETRSSGIKTDPVVLNAVEKGLTVAGLTASSGTTSKDIRTLGDAAQVVRSKNSGPYEVTFDLLFESPYVYQAIKESGVLTSESVAGLYGLSVEDMIYDGFFDQALAYKATVPRMLNGKRSVSGNFGEEDVHGSQRESLPFLESQQVCGRIPAFFSPRISSFCLSLAY